MYGVKFGEKHSYEDYGLILNSKSILAPSSKTNMINIPGANGSMDLTEALTGDIKYSNRTIKCDFTYVGSYNKFPIKWSELQNSLHGRKLKVSFDDDAYYYYVGRVELNEWKSDKSIGKISIEINAEPYKYEAQSSSEEWIWDIFNFESGVIRELSNIVINGTREVTVIGTAKKTIPIFNASSNMTVKYLGVSYQLSAGSNKIYDILLPNGENKLVFDGNGTVTIEFRGGCL